MGSTPNNSLKEKISKLKKPKNFSIKKYKSITHFNEKFQ